MIEARLWNRKVTIIARQWISETLASDADTYLNYLEETGVKECKATGGNQGCASLLKRSNAHTAIQSSEERS